MANTTTVAFEGGPSAPATSQLTIHNWPLLHEPVIAWFTLSLIAAVSYGAASLAGTATAGLLIGAGLGAAAWRLWMPVRFEIGPTGISQIVLRRRRRITWNSIGAWRAVRKGVLLSPFSGPPLRTALRGIYIHGGPRQGELVACLQYYLRAHSPEHSSGE